MKRIINADLEEFLEDSFNKDEIEALEETLLCEDFILQSEKNFDYYELWCGHHDILIKSFFSKEYVIEYLKAKLEGV